MARKTTEPKVIVVDGREYKRTRSGTYRDADGYDFDGRDRWGRDRSGFSRSGVRWADGARRSEARPRSEAAFVSLRTEAPDYDLFPDMQGFIGTAEARLYLLRRIAHMTARRTDVPFTMSAVVAPFRPEFRNPVLTRDEELGLLKYRATRTEFDALADEGLIVKHGARQWRLTETGATLARAVTPDMDEDFDPQEGERESA